MNYKPLLGINKTNTDARSAVNHWQEGILAWVIGDRNSETFELLWQQAQKWKCFWMSLMATRFTRVLLTQLIIW